MVTIVERIHVNTSSPKNNENIGQNCQEQILQISGNQPETNNKFRRVYS